MHVQIGSLLIGYEFIRGPLAWIAFAVFCLGMAFQIGRFVLLSRRRPHSRVALPVLRAPQPTPARERWIARLARWRTGFFGMDPALALCSVLFHAAGLVLPIGLLHHNSIMEQLWGVTLCPHVLSEAATETLSWMVFGGAGFFLLRRIFLRRVRAISTLYDYLTLVLALAPFVTGYLAIHGLFDYKTNVIWHILSVQLLLVCAPFTKFSHMLYFFINRFLLGTELSFGAGRRIWS